MMNINFELYKIFSIVAKNKNISKAAVELNISQPAVTQSIKTLEGELGGILFIRTKKGVVLTSEGEELYKYIQEGMNYFINGTNKFLALKKLDSGIIKIGASTVISENVLITYLKKFHEQFPNVEISIKNDLTDDLIKDLRNGNVDIILFSIPNKEIKDLQIYEIKELNDIFIGSEKYLFLKDAKINTILKEKIIVQQFPSVNRTNFENFIKSNGLNYNPSMEVVSHNLLVNFVKNNFGIGIATKEFVKKELNEKEIYEITTNIKMPNRKLGYAIMKNSIPSYTVKKFIDLLKSK